jgi:hypothetical protein
VTFPGDAREVQCTEALERLRARAPLPKLIAGGKLGEAALRLAQLMVAGPVGACTLSDALLARLTAPALDKIKRDEAWNQLLGDAQEERAFRTVECTEALERLRCAAPLPDLIAGGKLSEAALRLAQLMVAGPVGACNLSAALLACPTAPVLKKVSGVKAWSKLLGDAQEELVRGRWVYLCEYLIA